MAKVEELVLALKKDFGTEVVTSAANIQDTDRIPTGIFTLDLRTGGGFPKGKTSVVYGPESSNKTNVTLKAIASHQRLWPEDKCVFVDLESSFDGKWAHKMGVDIDSLVLVQPDYAEEASDIIEALLHAEDVGLIVLDSLAAMMTTNEGESSTEKVAVGGAAGVIGKFVRKSTKAQRLARREGRSPTMIWISQTRMKIGVMYGNPETFSGGNAPKFFSALTLRFYGKDVIDKQVHPELPCRKETKVIIKKYKVPITGTTCAFEMAVMPHQGLQVGECYDTPPILAHLKTFGWLGKVEGGKAWQLFGEEYDTQKACMEAVYSSEENLDKVKNAIIDRVMKESTGDEEDDDE